MAQSDFAVITCYFNPVEYESRRVNYFRYAESLERQGAHWVIEAALPDLEFAIPKTDQVIQVRLPEEGWLDCDILFHNDNWGQLASEALWRCACKKRPLGGGIENGSTVVNSVWCSYFNYICGGEDDYGG